MEKTNCWEFRQCGLGPGGARVAERGLCPVAQEGPYEGCNGGVHAGRSCWKVAGTLCRDMAHGMELDQITVCARCEFYRYMRQEAGLEGGVSLLWETQIGSGVPLVDGQHRRLLDLLEDVLAATGDPTFAIMRSLHFLNRYTKEHFKSEEQHMAEDHFPGLTEHAATHATFRVALAKLPSAIDRLPSAAERARLVKSVLLNWFIDHVKGPDQEYADHLRTKERSRLAR